MSETEKEVSETRDFFGSDADSSTDEEELADRHVNPSHEILWAAEKNEVDSLRKLLESDPTLVNARDEDSYTPLHRACYNNNVDVIKILLVSGAEIAAKTEEQWEPLHCACKWGNVEAASLLLQNGANVNATSKGGLTPLHLASGNSTARHTIELLLLNPYVDVTAKSESGDTAYEIARRTAPFYKLFEIRDPEINVY